VLEPGIIQGRLIGPAEVAQVRALLADHPEWSRRRISESVAQLWDWRNPVGQLKDMAARTLLLKLEARGWIELPARRRVPNNRMRSQRMLAPARLPDAAPIVGQLDLLLPLTLSEVSSASRPDERAVFDALLHHHHYLSHGGSIGENLRYLVRERQGRPVACVLFGAAAWQCQARDQFIGWDAATRERRLGSLANNTRFLVLPWVRVPKLASHVLGRLAQQVSADWCHKYGHPIELLETFVDGSRFTGTCYRAAQWIHVGQTTGRTRQNKTLIPQGPPKDVWLRPLRADFRPALCAS
jgi:hypothetical protein